MEENLHDYFIGACKHNKGNHIKILLRARSRKKIELNLDFTDRDGMTALMWASFKGHYNVVFQLMNYGANLTKRTPNTHMTALQFATASSHADIVKRLTYHRTLWFSRYIGLPLLAVVVILVAAYVSFPLCKSALHHRTRIDPAFNEHRTASSVWWVSVPLTLIALGFLILYLGDTDSDGDFDEKDAIVLIDDDKNGVLEMNELFAVGFTIGGTAGAFILVQVALFVVYAKFITWKNEMTAVEADRTLNEAKSEAQRVAARTISDANSEANRTINDANNKATATLDQAQHEAHQ